MRPILFELFGLPVRSFGVMVALGFLLGYWWTQRQAQKSGRFTAAQIGDLLVWVIVGGIVGARLLYVVIHFEQFRDDLLMIFAVWKGGLVYYGGFVGAFVAGWWFTRLRRISYLELADLGLPGAMLGQAVGRVGCLLVGDDFGRPAPDLPWAIRFPDVPESLMPPDLRGVPLHPTQIYMGLAALTVFAILAWFAPRARAPGQVTCLGLMLYAVGRSICEVYRYDDAARGVFLGVSTSQWISIPVFAIGLAGFIAVSVRARRAATS